MSYTCTCSNGFFSNISDCSQCNDLCRLNKDSMVSCIDNKTNTVIMGLGLTVFLIFLILSIVLLVFMIWFSIHVMRKCKGKPTWLNPTVITLLVLWVLLGWLPGFGFLDFIVLLIILLIHNQKCKT